MKGQPIMLRTKRRACAFCDFGPDDGENARAIFQTTSTGPFACAKHLRYVSAKIVSPELQATVDGIADGSIR